MAAKFNLINLILKSIRKTNLNYLIISSQALHFGNGCKNFTLTKELGS